MPDHVHASDLLRIDGDRRPTGKTHYIGVIVNPSSRWTMAARAVAAEVERYLRRVRDIEVNNLLDAVERGERKRETTGQLYAEMEKTAAEVARAKSDLKTRMRSASVTPGYAEAKYWNLPHDLALIAKLNAMSPSQRAALLAQVESEPGLHLEWVDALHRTPTALSEVSHEQRTRVRVAAVKTLRADIYKGLEAEAAELALAEAAVGVAGEVIADVIGSRADLTAHAPSTATLDGVPLAWPDTRVSAST